MMSAVCLKVLERRNVVVITNAFDSFYCSMLMAHRSIPQRNITKRAHNKMRFN